MSYSNRVLSDLINRENPFIRILVYENGLFEEYKVLRFKDIKSGSSFSESADSSGEMILEITDDIMFQEIIQLIHEKPVFFELLLNEVNVSEKIFNKFYIVNISLFEHNVLENKKTRTLNLISFTDMYEKNTIAEHTKSYVFEELPTDPDTGEKIIPDDYNKVVFESSEIEIIMFNLYYWNMMGDTSGNYGVWNRCKGDFHVTDFERGAKGIVISNTVDRLNQGLVTYISEKKSVYEIRESIYGMVKARGNKTRHILELFYNEITQLIECHFIARPDIDIIFDKSQDRFQFYRNEITRNNDIVDVLSESDGDFNLAENIIINPKPWQMKKIEGISSGSLDENGGTTGLISNAEEMANTNEIVDITEIELLFKDKKYFLDIKSGQVININGYSPLIDGEYFIEKISGVINDGYISYSLETLERIE